MTFKEFMEEIGYDSVTTFWDDFSIADKYGIAGVKDTYKRAFSEWKDDYKFFTELTLVLNHKIWQHYDSNRELAALFDINGRGNTERLVVRNPKLRNLLKDGEYIPSLRQLNLMTHYKDSINDALKYIGAEPLASAWFWSSTESSQYNAWYVYFFIGDTGSYSKYGSGRVRAVIDF